MKCPVDGATLAMSERSGVEIDYCPQCRGVWLDRGELDKILARADGDDAAPAAATSEPPRMVARPSERERDARDDDDPRYRHKKKESWWSEIFDF